MQNQRGNHDASGARSEASKQKIPSANHGARDWQRAHEELVRLAASRARLDRDEGYWLLVASREGTHARLGYASFSEYIERLFGYSPRFALEKLRVAEALDALPEMSRALDEGSLNWSAARELTRVATRDTEGDWLRVSAGKTAREIERLVSGQGVGSKPTDEPLEGLRRHVVRLEVSGETLATFRDATAKLRRDAGGTLDDDEMVLLLARHVLGGPTDAGRASYQVSLSICEHCRRGFQKGKGEIVEVEREIVEMAACDAQRLPETEPKETAEDAVDNFAHVGRGRRAAQSIPPAVRRRVVSRDAGRCVVPGCRHAVFVDVHHVDPKADGGDHTDDNLATLCGAHHRAVHRGELLVDRNGNGGFDFRHGDGTEYGARTVSPAFAEARAKAFMALRSLGFRETESKRAVECAVKQSGSGATTDSLLRAALRELTPSAAA